MSVYEKGIATVLGVALVMAVISIPLMLRKVPRNVVYGYRTRTTLSDDAIWYPVNARFGRNLMLASLVSAAGILALWAAGVSPFAFLPASVAVLVAPVLVAGIATSRFVRQLTTHDSRTRT